MSDDIDPAFDDAASLPGAGQGFIAGGGELRLLGGYRDRDPAAAFADKPALRVEGLNAWFRTGDREVQVVNDVSFELGRGRTLGVVGESGSGKSTVLLSILRLVSDTVGRSSARVLQLADVDLGAAASSQLQSIRGNDISLICQDPIAALNPMLAVGTQLADVIRAHNRVPEAEVKDRALRLLTDVGVSEPERRMRQYPSGLSGGMLQRCVIAMAIANEPAVLLADEPTTALDATISAQILDLLLALKSRMGMSMILVSHDLGVVSEVADEIAVMYAGRIVERGETRSVLASPQHPYTRGLLSSLPGRHPGRRLPVIEGRPPRPGALPQGCAFHPRCSTGRDRKECRNAAPALRRLRNREVACYFADTIGSS